MRLCALSEERENFLQNCYSDREWERLGLGIVDRVTGTGIVSGGSGNGNDLNVNGMD